MPDEDSFEDAAKRWSEMAEGVGDYAATLWAFYSALIAQGFSNDQAFTLVMGFLQEQLRNLRPPG